MISKKDILDYLESNYAEYKNNIQIYKNHMIEEINTLFNDVNSMKNVNQINAEKYFIEQIINEYIININLFIQRKNKLDNLKKLKLPEQRSLEWYEMRRDKLTASSLSAALGGDHYSTRSKCLYDKIVNTPHESSIYMTWGTKYEEIANLFYQLITKTNVLEFGLIPHPEFPAFGASPDGICDDTGPMEYTARMLEIKCPPKRKFTKTILSGYWMQMQGQLEVCDLDECDFLQVKLEEYENFEEYKNDIFDPEVIGKYSYPDVVDYNTTITGKNVDNLPKGCTITYKKEGEETLSYLYPKLLLSDNEYLQWIESYKEKNLNIIEIKWWKITRYELSTVLRDKKWWNNNIEHILSFYNDFVYYSDNIQELSNIVDAEAAKPKKKIITITSKTELPEFLLCDNSDSDD